MAKNRNEQPEVTYAVGDVVSGTVTDIDEDSWLWLDIEGWDAGVPPQDLVLAEGDSARERYTVDETIDGLFVWGVDHETRSLFLSVKRNAPGYLEALQQRAVGDVVSATVAEFQTNGGLWLDVDGLLAGVPPWDLDLAGGESAQQRYAVGETINGLFVWQIDHEARRLALSAKRNAPGYLEALQRRAAGDVVSATVAEFQSNGGLWLDVDGLVGAVGPQELDLDDGESAQDRYAVGQAIEGLLVRQVDHETRVLGLSVKRNAPGYAEALQRRAAGDVVSATVAEFQTNGGLWLDVDGLVGYVGPQELDLDDGESAQDRYAVGQAIEGLFVWQVNHEARRLALSAKRNAPGYLEALQQRAAGDVVSATVAEFQSNGGLWLDVDGLVGAVGPQELDLDDGESAQDRYAVGDTIDGLLVWQVDHETRVLGLSVKRNAPGYAEALQRRAAGDVVSATITFVGDGLSLDVNGLVGYVGPQELDLDDGESAQDRYAVGQAIEGLFVWQVNHEARVLGLSAKRNAPGYLEALQRRAVGEVVSATVTSFSGNSGLWLDVDGLVGAVGPQDLDLDDGESAQDRYAVCQAIEGLFVWQVNHEERDLALSAKRNAPGYAEALQRRAAGDVVSATVIDFWGNSRGLWLDVDGLVGAVGPQELDLDDGESAQDRYAVGQAIEGLFVWQVNHEERDLALSAKRNAPGYAEALDAIARGDDLDGIAAEANEWGVWLSAAGVVGWIPASELLLDDGESPQTRYAAGDEIKARVWQIDHEARDIILSVRRLATDFAEDPIVLGATIDATVRDSVPGGRRVLVADDTVIRVPYCELSLSADDPDGRSRPRFEYGQGIRVVVLAVDGKGQPTALSHRRALPDWQAEFERLTPGGIVQNAQIIPRSALPPGEDRLGLDLGPVTAFVDHDEVGMDDAQGLMLEEANSQHGVVIKSINEDREAVVVSRNDFVARWNELAEAVSEDEEIEAELRDIDGDTAFLDLGSGLLAEMPVEQILEAEPLPKRGTERIGETFTVLVTRKDADALKIIVEHREQPIVRLINQGESEKLEFKATLRRSPRTGEDDKGATFGVMKSIVGFLNSWDGGTLLVGVDDTGIPITGTNDELGALAIDRYTSEDEMIRALKDLTRRRIGASVFKWLDISFTDFRNTRILRVDCEPADSEVWLKGGKSGTSNQEEFFLRTPAATDPLDGRELVNYIQRRFPSSRPEDD